jgi:hypothetical protein
MTGKIVSSLVKETEMTTNLLQKLCYVYFIIPESNTIIPQLQAKSASIGVLDSRTIDRGFESRSEHTKDYEICICRFSATHAA